MEDQSRNSMEWTPSATTAQPLPSMPIDVAVTAISPPSTLDVTAIPICSIAVYVPSDPVTMDTPVTIAQYGFSPTTTASTTSQMELPTTTIPTTGHVEGASCSGNLQKNSARSPLKVKSLSDPSYKSSELLKAVFRKSYADLVRVLPMKDSVFIAELYTNELLSDALKEKIESMHVSSERATLFLDREIKRAIDINDERNFTVLVKVMEDFDDATVKKIGKKISTMLRKESFSKKTDEMDTSSSLDSYHHYDKSIISKPVEIDILNNNLCGTYNKNRCSPEGTEWPPHQPKSVVNVALIHYQGKERTKEQLFVIAELQRGGSDAINNLVISREYLPSPKKRCLGHSKISRSIADIFEADFISTEGTSPSEPPKHILIEGAPGIGKTVLVKEIAYRWANKEILHSTELLFLIYLRDPRVQKAKSLEQLVELYTVSTEVARTVSKYFFQCDGEKIAFLIDGFDEYPAALRKSSFIVDIIKHINVSKSIVVVTSRPTATVALYDYVERRIEILGFAEEDRNRYISESLCKFPGKEKELHKYLKEKPTINGFCFVPLHLSILLYLLKYQDSLPETLTEMNESFIVHTIHRHLERNQDEVSPSNTISKLTHLPDHVLDFVHKLSTLAFKGLQENKLVFSQSEIETECPVISNTVNGYDLLQAVEHYPLNKNKAAGKTTSFNFLHYTMQEFLAALHISRLSDEEQLSLMQDTFWNENFNFMWMMYIGITGTKSKLFNQFISKGKLYKKGGVKLLDYISKDKRKRLHLFQCFIEAKGKGELPNIITSMFKDGKIKFNQTLHPCHISSLIAFLTHSGVWLCALELNNCHLGDNGMNIVKQFIANNRELASTLSYVDLQNNNSSPWGVYCVVIDKCSVDSLTVFGDDGMEDYVKQIAQSLQNNTTLQSLSLCEIGRIGLKSIEMALKSIDLSLTNCNSRILTLKKINLSWLKLDTEKSNILFYIAFPIYNKVTGSGVNKEIAINILWDKASDFTSDTLDLSDKLGKNIEILYFIVFGLYNNKTLCKLDLSNNSRCLKTDEGVAVICDCLKSNTVLKEFYLSNNCIEGSKVRIIAEALQTNRTLQKFNISGNKILYDGAVAISCCLEENTTLQELDISNNGIACEADELGESFKVENTVQQLNKSTGSTLLNTGTAEALVLTHCNLKMIGIFQINKLSIASNNISSATISSCIKNNMVLQELNISENTITTTGIEIIADAITMNSVLQTLDISRNWITSKGLLCLLKAKSKLKALNITHNNVTKSEFRKLTLQSSSQVRVYASWNEIVIVNEQAKCKSIIFEIFNSKASHCNEDVWSFEKISDLDCRTKFLSNCLKEDSTLQHLNLCDHIINSTRARTVAKAIELNRTLRKLDISCNTLSNKGALVFSECLKNNTSLQELNMSENNIGNKAIVGIAEVIKINATLMKLDISKNWITSEALLYLLEAVKANSVLQFLNITCNNVTKSEYAKLKQFIKELLLQIQVSWNEIDFNTEIKFIPSCKTYDPCIKDFLSETSQLDPWQFEKIADYDSRIEFLSVCLKENNTFKELNLRNKNISDVGAVLIAQAIEVHKTLEVLNISKNALSDDGVTAFSMYLSNNDVLQDLDMSENKISNRGANEVAKLIETNLSLKVLDISNMCINDDGITSISECLKSNSCLCVLNLSLNKITSIGAKEIAEALKNNNSLIKLDITGNKISDSGASAISDCLRHNDCLQELDMTEINISSEGAIHIADAITRNKCLRTLHLHHHNIDDSLSFNMRILGAVHCNDTLEKLKMPWVHGKDEDVVKAEVKKINKERKRRNPSHSLLSVA